MPKTKFSSTAFDIAILALALWALAGCEETKVAAPSKPAQTEPSVKEQVKTTTTANGVVAKTETGPTPTDSPCPQCDCLVVSGWIGPSKGVPADLGSGGTFTDQDFPIDAGSLMVELSDQDKTKLKMVAVSGDAECKPDGWTKGCSVKLEDQAAWKKGADGKYISCAWIRWTKKGVSRVAQYKPGDILDAHPMNKAL